MAAASTQTKLLVVEPNGEIRKSLTDFFSKKGFAVAEEANPAKVSDRMKENSFSCVITEMDFAEGDPLGYVQTLHSAAPETPIVVLTAKGNVSTAVKVMQHGAHHVIQKPILLKEVETIVNEALALSQKETDFKSLLPYFTTQLFFEVPGTLSQIESVIDNMVEEVRAWKIVGAPAEAAFRSAMRSALHNAVIHGNKGDEKKKVRVNFILCEKRIDIAVTDEGNGFIPSMYINPKDLSASPDKMNSGLMRIYCFFDKVSFNAKGNQIRMTKLAKV